MADMSGVPYAIAVLLVVGVVVLRRMRPAAAHSRTRVWLPIAAFVAGPIVAFLYFLADVFLISRDYITAEDYTQMLISLMILGLFGGVIGAIGLGLETESQLAVSANMVFTQGRGFVVGATFGLQNRSLR